MANTKCGTPEKMSCLASLHGLQGAGAWVFGALSEACLLLTPGLAQFSLTLEGLGTCTRGMTTWLPRVAVLGLGV